MVKHLTEAGDDLSPIDAAVAALTRGGAELAQYRDFGRVRQELIASSPELQERELIKMASLASAIAEALDDSAGFDVLMQRSLAEFRQAAGVWGAPPS